MTDITFEKQPVRRFDLPRLRSVFLQPRQLFTELASDARASWSMPMLILSLTALLVALVSGYLRTRAAMLGEIPLPPDWQYWTPEMQNNYMQAQQATQGATFMYVIPFVGSITSLWLGWIVLGGLLHLGSTLIGGRGSMQNALNVVAWASLPFALRDVLRIGFMLITKHVIVSPGLSGFASGTGFLSQLLARMDLFLLWFVILLMIGFAIVDGLPRGKAVLGVTMVLLIVILAQAGLGTLTSNLGGTVIQRPYF